jgi:hypothetical protein
MRHFRRIVMLMVMLGLASALGGCENFDADKLDFLGLSTKKPLPGERKAVFPEGVPGVTQGIPPEYLRNNVQQEAGTSADGTQIPGEASAAPAPATLRSGQTATAEPPTVISQTDSKSEAAIKPKPKPKPRVVKRVPENAPTQARSQDQNTQEQQLARWPAQTQAQPQPATQPAQQGQPAQSPWPEPQPQNTVAPWPSAPPPGTFSK